MQPILEKMIWQKPLNSKERLIRIAWISHFNINLDVLKYYTDKRVLFEIVKHLGNRELIFDKNIRWLYASKIDSLLFCMTYYQVFEELKTFYFSLADYNLRERAPFSRLEKNNWQDNYWTSKNNPEFVKHVKDFSLAFDFDGETVEEAYKDASKLFDYLNSYKIKFAVWFSGVRGFHFYIPAEEFKALINPFSAQNCVLFCQALALDISDKLKLKTTDTSIYTISRMIKQPFSLDKRNKKVIFPLSNEEFRNFIKLQDTYTSMNYVLSQPNLGYLGIYRGRESNPEGFNKLVEDLG